MCVCVWFDLLKFFRFPNLTREFILKDFIAVGFVAERESFDSFLTKFNRWWEHNQPETEKNKFKHINFLSGP